MDSNGKIKKEIHLIELPKINDPRGNLTFIESGMHVPFEVKRNYWIYDVPSGILYPKGAIFLSPMPVY